MADDTDWMVTRAELRERFPLDIQSRGRALSKVEEAFADALEAVFATGTHEMGKVAEALAEKGVEAPVSGGTDWTVAKLEAELKATNADLDQAFQEHGYGA